MALGPKKLGSKLQACLEALGKVKNAVKDLGQGSRPGHLKLARVDAN